jgi:hypothetical protein
MWIALLGFTLSCASSRHALPTPPSLTAAERDSAGVFSAVVERLIHDDSASAVHAAFDTSPDAGLPKLPRVFVRIRGMPKGAWAEPGVARLRAHRWFYDGRAMDSTRALAQRAAVLGLGLRSTPFPAELSLRIDFTGDTDTASVTEYWAWNTCEERRGLLSIFFYRHLVARAADGWHWVEHKGAGTIDALCHR